MSHHRVAQHLSVSPEAYDKEIRRFVPGYAAMLDEVGAVLSAHLAREDATILDLGAGTGALSQSLAARFARARFILLDTDAAMLAQARGRLGAEVSRCTLHQGSFADPLPACDAAVASLALHHAPTRETKRMVYANARQALTPGGVLINADAMISAHGALRDALLDRWAAHLVAHGDTRAQAFERFAQWSKEDFYFGIEEELGLLKAAGFAEADVRWRQGPIAVIVALKV